VVFFREDQHNGRGKREEEEEAVKTPMRRQPGVREGRHAVSRRDEDFRPGRECESAGTVVLSISSRRSGDATPLSAVSSSNHYSASELCCLCCAGFPREATIHCLCTGGCKTPRCVPWVGEGRKLHGAARPQGKRNSKIPKPMPKTGT